MQYAENILETIGKTPLVRLSRFGRDVPGLFLAKLEMFNPGGSVKDRIGLRLVESCEEDGRLQPGGTIIEPTSGNTGTGLAMAAAIKGYKCIFVMTDKVAEEKRNLLRAYGAEIIICPSSVSVSDPASYQSVAARLAKEIPGACSPNQYDNPANPMSHVATTGPEIWEATDGKITHFVAGIGTAGTIIGTSRFLKSKNPNIQVIGADPEGSVYSGDEPKPYKVEGIGMDHFPHNYDASLVDDFVRVSDKISFALIRRLAREEGILAGPSSGTALAAALEIGAKAGPDAVIVTLIPDTGRGYLSKAFNETWLRENGLTDMAQTPQLQDLLKYRDTSQSPPLVVSVAPDDSVMKAIELMHSYGISQLPVVHYGKVVGGISESIILQRLASGASLEQRTVGEWQGPAMPQLPETATVDQAYHLFIAGHTAIAIISADAQAKLLGVASRSDLLGYWSTAQHE